MSAAFLAILPIRNLDQPDHRRKLLQSPMPWLGICLEETDMRSKHPCRGFELVLWLVIA